MAPFWYSPHRWCALTTFKQTQSTWLQLVLVGKRCSLALSNYNGLLTVLAAALFLSWWWWFVGWVVQIRGHAGKFVKSSPNGRVPRRTSSNHRARPVPDHHTCSRFVRLAEGCALFDPWLVVRISHSLAWGDTELHFSPATSVAWV